MFEEKEKIDFNIDKNFQLRDELIETLMTFEEMFTSSLNLKHLLVPPYEIKLRDDANLQKSYPRKVAPHIQEKVEN